MFAVVRGFSRECHTNLARICRAVCGVSVPCDVICARVSSVATSLEARGGVPETPPSQGDLCVHHTMCIVEYA